MDPNFFYKAPRETFDLIFNGASKTVSRGEFLVLRHKMEQSTEPGLVKFLISGSEYSRLLKIEKEYLLLKKKPVG